VLVLALALSACDAATSTESTGTSVEPDVTSQTAAGAAPTTAPEPSDHFAAVAAALTDARLRWSHAGIASYRLVVAEFRNYWSRGCTWASVVVDGVVSDMSVTTSPESGAECREIDWTVEQLHDGIDGDLGDIDHYSGPEWGAHTLDVTFDDIGVPISIEYDLANGNDEETSMRVTFTSSTTHRSTLPALRSCRVSSSGLTTRSCRLDAFESGPPDPATLLEQTEQRPCGRDCLEKHLVEQRHQIVVEIELDPWIVAPLPGIVLEHRDEPIRQRRQAVVIRGPIGRLDEVEVHPHDSWVLDLASFERHQGRHLVGDLGCDEDPGVTLHLDGPRRDLEPAETFEVVDCLGGQREAVACGQLGDPFSMPLALGDLGEQASVDVVDRRTELVLVGPEELVHSGEGHTGVGQGPDPDQLDHRRSVVAPVARPIACRLRQQTLRVVVTDCAHGHAGVRRELADGQHLGARSIEPVCRSVQASLRR
jgi:hypothetical protein